MTSPDWDYLGAEFLQIIERRPRSSTFRLGAPVNPKPLRESPVASSHTLFPFMQRRSRLVLGSRSPHCLLSSFAALCKDGSFRKLGVPYLGVLI